MARLRYGNMTNAQKCPVCEGSGLVASPFGDKKCHGCNGKGWVEVVGVGISHELLCNKFGSTARSSKTGFQCGWDQYCEGKI